MTESNDRSAPTRSGDGKARERAYLQQTHMLQQQVDRLTQEIKNLRQQVHRLEKARRDDHRVLKRHQARLERLRIDRQLLGFPRWLAERLLRRQETSAVHQLRPSHSPVGRHGRSLLVVGHKYPSKEFPYGGQPIERRIRFYQSAGFEVTVFVPSTSGDAIVEEDNGVRVVRDDLSRVTEVAESLVSPQLCIHSPTPEVWSAAKSLAKALPTHVWIHGFEARNWRDLAFNFTAQEIEERGAKLDAINVERKKTLIDVFGRDDVTKIFVSDFIRDTAETFAGVVAGNAHVIHNVIDTELFAADQAKEEEDRRRILVVRSFSARNYATDLVARTIRLLADQAWFGDVSFEIRGDGRHFDEDTQGLEAYSNVSVVRGIVNLDQLQRLFEDHGTLLIPSRWDSQGMTMGEAMAAGLVPVTNRVAAIPEFADDSSAVLSEPNDAEGLAAGIEYLYRNPTQYREMSTNAIQRALTQCGPTNTVQREIQIFEESLIRR